MKEPGKVLLFGIAALLLLGFFFTPDRTEPRAENAIVRFFEMIGNIISRNPDIASLLLFVFIILFLAKLLLGSASKGGEK